jgi:Ubiquitin-protein ligase
MWKLWIVTFVIIGRCYFQALYENLLVEIPLAEFFLLKLVGRYSDVDVHHLASLDPIMYRNLLSLKSYEGDVADLGLDFTVLNDELGERRVRVTTFVLQHIVMLIITFVNHTNTGICMSN